MADQDKKKWRMLKKAVIGPEIITLSGDEATPDFSKDWHEFTGYSGYRVGSEYGEWQCGTSTENISSYAAGDPKKALDRSNTTYQECGSKTPKDSTADMFLGTSIHFPEEFIGCPSQVSVTCQYTTKVKLVGRLKGSKVTETISVYDKSNFSSKETITLESDGRYYQWIGVICKCTASQFDTNKVRVYEVKFTGDCKLQRVLTTSVISEFTENVIPELSSTSTTAVDSRGETWTATAQDGLWLNGNASGVLFDGKTTLYYTHPSSKDSGTSRVLLEFPEGYLVTPSSISIHCRGTSDTDQISGVYGSTTDNTLVYLCSSLVLSKTTQWVDIPIPSHAKYYKLKNLYVAFQKRSSTSAVYGPRVSEIRIPSGTLYKVINYDK